MAGRRSSDKVMTLKEATKLVKDGDHVSFGGFAITRDAACFARELVRANKKNLKPRGALSGDLLVGAGCGEGGGGGSLDRFGLLHRGQEWARKHPESPPAGGSVLTWNLSALAAAMGIPFIPSKTMLGTDTLRQTMETHPGKYKVMKCPFTGETLLLVRAAQPADVAVIHTHQADKEGNARIWGPVWAGLLDAKAAKKLIVTTEEIVPNEIIRREPEKTIIQSYQVDAVVWAPFGCHPLSLYRGYDYDAEHLMLYQEHAKTQEGFDKYLEEWVLGVDDEWGYLQKIGIEKLLRLRADPIKGYSNIPLPTITGAGYRTG